MKHLTWKRQTNELCEEITIKHIQIAVMSHKITKPQFLLNYNLPQIA